MCESCQARSKAIGLEPILAGVRAFELRLLHFFINCYLLLKYLFFTF